MIIDKQWRPHKKTSNSLLRIVYSQDRLNSIGKQFIERYDGEDVQNASTAFYEMVKSSGAADNLPKPDRSKEEALDAKRKADIDNKVVKDVGEDIEPMEAMSRREVIEWMNNQGRSLPLNE